MLGRGQVAGQDHLHRHQAVESLLPRLVDHAHPAAPDLLEQLILAEMPRRLIQGLGRRGAFGGR